MNENTVKVLYLHKERRQEFLIEWSNIDPATGQTVDWDLQTIGYELQINCMSSSMQLNEIIENAIMSENQDLGLYLELRDTFNRQYCESLKD